MKTSWLVTASNPTAVLHNDPLDLPLEAPHMMTRLLKFLGITVKKAEVLVPGDHLRFTTQLLEEIQALPHQTTALVKITRISTQPDGTKKIWLVNPDKPTFLS
jgi:hypothetical protein